MTLHGEAHLMVGRVDGIEELLDPVDVLTGADELVLVDLRLRAGAVDLRDRVLAQQNQPALADIELVAVESADRRACCAVPLGVVLAAVARAPEACRDGRVEDDLTVRRLLLDRREAEDLPRRAVRLHRAAEMRAAVGDDREARNLLPARLDRAVVPDERRAP